MARNPRNTVLLVKAESTYGVDPTPTGAANAVLASKPKLTPLVANTVDRELVRGWLGNSEQLVGPRYARAEFTLELVGSGTAGTAPAMGPLLQACGLAEVIIAVTRVDYTPVSASFSSVTAYWYDDGVLHMLKGARGTAKLSLNVGGRPEVAITLTGLYSTPSAASPSGVTYAAWKTPVVVSDLNTADIVLGGTVAATGAPAIAGGTTYTSTGLQVDMGNDVQFVALVGNEAVDIVDRGVTGSLQLDLTAAQEVTLMGVVEANTLQAVSMVHGVTAGYKVMVHQPNVQLTDPSLDDVSARRLIGFKTRAVPGATGNDELRLVFF